MTWTYHLDKNRDDDTAVEWWTKDGIPFARRVTDTTTLDVISLWVKKEQQPCPHTYAEICVASGEPVRYVCLDCHEEVPPR